MRPDIQVEGSSSFSQVRHAVSAIIESQARPESLIPCLLCSPPRLIPFQSNPSAPDVRHTNRHIFPQVRDHRAAGVATSASPSPKSRRRCRSIRTTSRYLRWAGCKSRPRHHCCGRCCRWGWSSSTTRRWEALALWTGLAMTPTWG